jgi:hypothetical protein
LLLLVVPISGDAPSSNTDAPLSSPDEGSKRLPPTADLPQPGASSAAVDAGQPTRSDDARISPVVATCDVLVVSPFDAAVPEASVVIEDGDGLLGEGRWPSVASLTVAAGEVALHVSADGWGSTRTRVSPADLRALGEQPLRVVLEPDGLSWGRIVDERAAPLGGPPDTP